MDLINSYKSMKALHELQQERNKLLKRQRLAELTRKLSSLNALKESLNVNIKQIKTCTENINFKFDNVEERITGKSEKRYIPMSKECAQNFKDINNNIIEILYNTQGIAEDNIDQIQRKDLLECLAQEISICQNDNRNLHKYGVKLIHNIKGIKYKSITSNIEQDESNKVISSDKKQRLRRSHLSESTFFNTFQANNVSASSPIGESRTESREVGALSSELQKKLF